jgi:hypothetical protein
VRPLFAFPIIIALLLAACSGRDRDAQGATASPAPLLSCESREIHVGDADVVLTANVDSSLANVTIISAPDDRARADALAYVKHAFGETKRDSRVELRPWHLGLAKPTDPCGRPVTPPSPSASPVQ